MQNNNNLAKISLGINIVLIICVIILFTRGGNSTSSTEVAQNDTNQVDVVKPNDSELKIGYFMTDSLNSQLLLMKDVEGDMMNAQKTAEDKMRGKQAEIDRWKKKWEDKGPLLSSEQEQYQIEAQKMQLDAMEFEQKVQMDLAAKQENIMFTLYQRISNFSKIFAEKNNFDMIMSYQLGQNPVYIHPSLDVTKGLVKLMNDDYNSTFSGEEKSNQTEENNQD